MKIKDETNNYDITVTLIATNCSDRQVRETEIENKQRIIVIVENQNQSNNFSASDIFVVDSVEIGKVDSVGIINDLPAYYISVFQEFHIPIESKVILESQILIGNKLNLLSSAKQEFKNVDTILVSQDLDFSYSFEINNLNLATRDDIMNMRKSLSKLDSIETLKFASISMSGQEYHKKVNSKESFGPSKVFVPDSSGGGSFVPK